MNKILKTVSKVATVAGDKSPAILTAFAVVGVVGTAYMAGKATLKANEILDSYRDIDASSLDRETKKKCAWELFRCYAPTVVSAGVTISCILGANHINARRIAALGAGYNLATSVANEYRDYRQHIRDKYGQEEDQEAKDYAVRDRIGGTDPGGGTQIIFTGDHECMFMDSYSGRAFMSTRNKIEEAKNKLNNELINEMYISLNDMYSALDLDPVKHGDELGWNINDGLIGFDYSAKLNTKGEPVVLLDYDIMPRYDYRRLH